MLLEPKLRDDEFDRIDQQIAAMLDVVSEPSVSHSAANDDGAYVDEPVVYVDEPVVDVDEPVVDADEPVVATKRKKLRRDGEQKQTVALLKK